MIGSLDDCSVTADVGHGGQSIKDLSSGDSGAVGGDAGDPRLQVLNSFEYEADPGVISVS